jgi:hypothetical protein
MEAQMKSAFLALKLVLKVFIICLGLSLTAYADIKIQGPITTAYDCPSSSIVKTISPDNSALSILLNGTLLMEHHPNNSAPNIINKRCVIHIPLKGFPKQQYVILNHDWRLYAGLPDKAKLTVTSQIWLSSLVLRANNVKKRVTTYYKTNTRNYNGPYDNNITFSQQSREPRVTECGKSVDLTLEFKMKLNNRNPTDDALVDVDSYDLGQTPGTIITKRDCE